MPTTPALPSPFALSLARLRQTAGMTVDDAAQAMHTAPRYLALVEAGERRPTTGWVRRASRVYAEQIAANAVTKAQTAMQTVTDLFAKYGIDATVPNARQVIRARFTQGDLDTYTAALAALDGQGAIQ